VDGDAKRMAWFGVAIGVAVVALILALAVAPSFSPRWPIAVMAAAVALEATVAAMAWMRYRDSRDPHALLVCVAFVVLAVQGFAFGVLWPIAVQDDTAIWAVSTGLAPTTSFPLGGTWELTSAYAWQAGWLIAAGALLLGRPWWERRGRAPLRPVAAFLTAGVALLVIDGVLLRVRPERFPGGGAAGGLREAGAGVVGPGPTTGGWILAAIAVAFLGVAAWREHQASRGPEPSPACWLAGAAVLAIPLQVLVARHPVEGLPFIHVVDLLQPVVAALALAGYVVHERAQVSRMRRASDRADEVLEGRAEIAAMVSHEVRGPVSTIRGLAATAKNQYERLSEDERREFLGMIEQESDRLLDTATQASLGLKVDADTLAYDLREQDLEPAILAGVTAAVVGDHALTIAIEPDLRAVIDRKWFAEAVHQLVQNAAKFSPPEAPIDITASREDTWIVVDVADRGPGIDPAQVAAVFEKFTTWRPEGYSNASGSGLGLFITRGIVSKHQGTVLPAEREGGGTMLRIRLPRTEGSS
jgi:signal transduction histidine kinase